MLYREVRQHNEYLNDLAIRFNQTKLVEKAVRAMLWYLIHRRERNQKKTILYQTVQTVDFDNTLRACFEHLAILAQNTKQLNKIAENYRQRSLRRNVLRNLAL